MSNSLVGHESLTGIKGAVQMVQSEEVTATTNPHISDLCLSLFGLIRRWGQVQRQAANRSAISERLTIC